MHRVVLQLSPKTYPSPAYTYILLSARIWGKEKESERGKGAVVKGSVLHGMARRLLTHTGVHRLVSMQVLYPHKGRS